MKVIVGILYLILAVICYVKPELLPDKVNLIYACIFISLANLFFDRKD